MSENNISVERDFAGTLHIKVGDFDYVQIQYQYPYTDNASQNVLAKRVVELLTRPAQTEQQPAYVECRECTDCGHVGINDAHQTDATCAMCDWSGPSPVEDQCPDCGKENVMGAACPKCSGRYRILAETHVAAPIAQTAPHPEQSERWQSVTRPGQIDVGDWLSFTVGGCLICAKARDVLNPGTDREEVIYNRAKNYYFITRMAVDGSSSHKGVMRAAPCAHVGDT